MSNPKPESSLTLLTCYLLFFVGSAPRHKSSQPLRLQAPERGVQLASVTSGQFTRRNNE